MTRRSRIPRPRFELLRISISSSRPPASHPFQPFRILLPKMTFECKKGFPYPRNGQPRHDIWANVSRSRTSRNCPFAFSRHSVVSGIWSSHSMLILWGTRGRTSVRGQIASLGIRSYSVHLNTNAQLVVQRTRRLPGQSHSDSWRLCALVSLGI